MSPEQSEKRQAIIDAHDHHQFAVVEVLSRSYVQQFPHDVSVWLRRGQALSNHRNYDEADVAFDEAERCGNTHTKPILWLVKAQSFNNRGQFLEAEELYLKILEVEPENCWVWVELGLITWKRGALLSAEQHFRKAVATGGEEQDKALLNLGGVLTALGHLQEAADCYREGLRISPDYETAQKWLDDVEAALYIQQEQE